VPKKAILRKNPDMVTRVIDDEAILMPVFKSSKDMRCIYTLNKVANRVWELIDGKRTLDAIKNTILKEFDTTPAEVDKRLAKLIKDLREAKAII